ncbi:MAG: hypothetical protein ALECFALPRED_004960 [Alectoria fallacina]|uniref:Uncharacterized protein n=1 Tax=Alectoria fallacina TaxID=1903189 RepID=A0A8H3FV08_9LECA|nr:MAG: hypothetical protein ALECFALPRED_004960 [Alectoria fallacina]
MRLFLVLLALSALAAAGPLPLFSKATLEVRAPPSTPANNSLDSDPVAALTQLKAIYDSLNEPEPSANLKLKRDFWAWLKDAFESPGLKARSSVSASTPDDNTLSPDPVATLTKLKAVYDSLNEKRMESGLKVKRDFWKWLKDMFDSPGLKARSFDDHSVIHSNSDNVSKTKRTCAEVSGSEGPIFPPVNSHGQHIRRHLDVKRGVPARKCDLNFEAGP